MKKYLMISLSFVTVASFVACGTDNRSEQAAKAARKANGDKTASADKKGDESANKCVGGQPGLINLGGVLWTTADAATKDAKGEAIDKHIVIVQKGGKNVEGQEVSVSAKEKAIKMTAPEKTTLDVLEKTAAAKTYINIGCANLENDVKEITTYTSVPYDISSENKDGAPKSATRIYVCGKQEVSAKILTLIGNELILQDGAELTFKGGAPGSIAIYAEKLILNGNSSIILKAEDSLATASDASSLNLNIIKGIEAGTEDKGQLTISSTGANCVEEAVEKEAPQEDESLTK